MNYIRELNAFYDWLESNPCPSDAIALWHAIVAIANKAGWPKEFTVANSTLQTKAGLSRVKLDRWRGFLKDKELIRYQKSTKVNEAGRYSLVPFFPIVQNDTQDDTQDSTRDDTQNDTQNDTQDEIQNVHINKLNKTKQKHNAHDVHEQEFEQFWIAYPRKVGKGRALSQWKARIKEKESAETLIRCAENYAVRCKSLKTEEQFIKHPSTFLSAKGDYLDFAAAPPEPHSEKPEFVAITDEERERMREIYRKQAERNLARAT